MYIIATSTASAATVPAPNFKVPAVNPPNWYTINATMNYSKPTISVALKKLKEKDLVAVDESGNVTLTEKGLPIAEKTYEKHNTIASLLIAIGVDTETAYNDSCHIEHCLSDESFDAIKRYVQKTKL